MPNELVNGIAAEGRRDDSGPRMDEQDFRRLLDQLPEGAYTCDTGGLITYYNRAAVELWGRSPKLNDPIDRF
jgi:PAS domain-containing protein